MLVLSKNAFVNSVTTIYRKWQFGYCIEDGKFKKCQVQEERFYWHCLAEFHHCTMQ